MNPGVVDGSEEVYHRPPRPSQVRGGELGRTGGVSSRPVHGFSWAVTTVADTWNGTQDFSVIRGLELVFQPQTRPGTDDGKERRKCQQASRYSKQGSRCQAATCAWVGKTGEDGLTGRVSVCTSWYAYDGMMHLTPFSAEWRMYGRMAAISSDTDAHT